MLNVENTTRAGAEAITMEDINAMNYAELWELVPDFIGREQDNESIISRAAYAAAGDGKISLERADLIAMILGSAPRNIHTYNEWKSRGYIVKHGEHAAFTATIWKHTERRGELTAEQAEAINAVVANADAHEGDETVRNGFIRKNAFFFTAEQVEELAELEELPADCEKRTENGKEIITGNTKPIKEQLKASGYRWHRKNHYWFKFVA